MHIVRLYSTLHSDIQSSSFSLFLSEVPINGIDKIHIQSYCDPYYQQQNTEYATNYTPLQVIQQQVAEQVIKLDMQIDDNQVGQQRKKLVKRRYVLSNVLRSVAQGFQEGTTH